MTGDPRPPWWASGDDPDTVEDPDPVARHRAARRGGEPDDPTDGAVASPSWVPAVEAVTRLGRDLAAATGGGSAAGEARGGEDRDPAGHGIDACGVCPICVGLRALGEVRPELAGHLAEAARHLALAVRTVVDAAVPADPATAARDGPDTAARVDSDGGLTRIDLDGDP